MSANNLICSISQVLLRISIINIFDTNLFYLFMHKCIYICIYLFICLDIIYLYDVILIYKNV